MSTTVTTSKRFTINWNDASRGLLIAVVTAVLTSLYNITVKCGIACIDWKDTAGIAIAAGLAYLLKNLFTPSEIVLKNPSPSSLEAVESGQAEIKVLTKK